MGRLYKSRFEIRCVCVCCVCVCAVCVVCVCVYVFVGCVCVWCVCACVCVCVMAAVQCAKYETKVSGLVPYKNVRLTLIRSWCFPRQPRVSDVYILSPACLSLLVAFWNFRSLILSRKSLRNWFFSNAAVSNSNLTIYLTLISFPQDLDLVSCRELVDVTACGLSPKLVDVTACGLPPKLVDVTACGLSPKLVDVTACWLSPKLVDVTACGLSPKLVDVTACELPPIGRCDCLWAVTQIGRCDCLWAVT